MKTVTIKTISDAVVTETWVYEVDDDFELPDSKDEQDDFALEMLSGEDGTWDGQPIPATFRSVDDEVDNETNRRVLSAEVTG